MSLELRNYVKDALSRGATKESIMITLSQSGWAKDVIQKTLEQFSGVDSQGVPIPAPRMYAHQIARDWFIYLLGLITLSISAYALGALFFNLIEHYIADPANRYGYNDAGGISWAVAQLVVALPVYMGLSQLTQKDIVKHPEKRESLIRKLVIYAILGITSIVGLGDLICVLANFLGGELTFRFLAKALVVLTISVLVFIYYLFEMRRDDVLVKQAEQMGG